MLPSNRRFIQDAAAGSAKLWRVWWFLGIPVGLATNALTIAAELVRDTGTGYWGWGDLLDVLRLLVYFGWARLAWRCSQNVEDWRWTPVSRIALSAGFVLQAMF